MDLISERWTISSSPLIFESSTLVSDHGSAQNPPIPKTWTKISAIIELDERAHKTLEKSQEKSGLTGDILLGASLGPVFSSCSPTYALILATVLPTSWILGITYLIVYTLGLSLVMFLVAFFGQKIIKKLKWAVNPNGVFRKVLGTIFLLVGLSIIFGIDKQIEAWVLDQ